MLSYAKQIPHTKYAPSGCWLSTKRLSTEKFHNAAVKIGQNMNKIGNMKIIENKLTKLELHLKRYLQRK